MKVHQHRARTESELDVTIGRLDRSGICGIAPGETSRWKREGLAAELSQSLGVEVRLVITPGRVQFTTVPTLPHSVKGCSHFDLRSGAVVVGLDVATGQPGGFSIREESGLVVGAMPGAGKTVLLSHVRSALAGRAVFHYFDGKLDAPEEFVTHLKEMQKVMEQRLARRLDFWNTQKPPKLLVAVLDEAQRVFQASGSSKEEKAAAEERGRLVRDLVQRGRSAGVVVVLASQRLTSDAIPTAVRDILGVKIAGRVTRPEDAELVLGRRPGPEEPSPVGAQPGRFVVLDGSGELRELQVYTPTTG